MKSGAVLVIRSGRLAKILTLDYWRSFLKFNVVGLSGVAVNEGIFILLRSLGIYYLYASAIAVETSIISNFFLNDVWTFRDRRSGSIVVRMVKFNALMIVGLAAQLAIVYGVTEYLGVDSTLSNLVGIGGAFILRYFLSIRYAWMYEKPSTSKPVEHSVSMGKALFQRWSGQRPKPDIRRGEWMPVCQPQIPAFR